MDQEPQESTLPVEVNASKDNKNVQLPGMLMREKIMQEAIAIVIPPTDKDEDGRLLGLNGKPSLLDEQHWRMVRTPTFIGWLGDWRNTDAEHGVMTDENGEPQLLWHASRKGDIEEFEVNKLLFAGGGSARFKLEALRTKEDIFSVISIAAHTGR